MTLKFPLPESAQQILIDQLVIADCDGSLRRQERLADFYKALPVKQQIIVEWLYDHKGCLFIGYNLAYSMTPKFDHHVLLLESMYQWDQLDGNGSENVRLHSVEDKPVPGAYFDATHLNTSDCYEVQQVYRRLYE